MKNTTKCLLCSLGVLVNGGMYHVTKDPLFILPQTLFLFSAISYFYLSKQD